jgi:predicted nuclease of predicted toxin-antitoxin system
VRVLLDENFPLKLLRVLREDGIDADHVITLDRRGAPDSYVRQHLGDPELLFLTHGEDHLFRPPSPRRLSCRECDNRVG